MTTQTLNRDPKLQEIVARLRSADKLPAGQSIEDKAVQTAITPAQKQILFVCFDRFEAFMEANEKVEDISAPDPADKARWTELWLACRHDLQQAIVEGLLHMTWIQERAVFFGAIPQPKDHFKYFGDPSGTMQCWKCGAEVEVISQSCSVWFRRGPACAGSGQVVAVPRPFCPVCESKPSPSGIIYDDELPGGNIW